MWKGKTSSSRVRVTLTVGQLVRIDRYDGYEELECMVCGVRLAARRGLRELRHRRDCPVGLAYRIPRTRRVEAWETRK